jgi:hypothetical protein
MANSAQAESTSGLNGQWYTIGGSCFRYQKHAPFFASSDYADVRVEISITKDELHIKNYRGVCGDKGDKVGYGWIYEGDNDFLRFKILQNGRLRNYKGRIAGRLLENSIYIEDWGEVDSHKLIINVELNDGDIYFEDVRMFDGRGADSVNVLMRHIPN